MWVLKCFSQNFQGNKPLSKKGKKSEGGKQEEKN